MLVGRQELSARTTSCLLVLFPAVLFLAFLATSWTTVWTSLTRCLCKPSAASTKRWTHRGVTWLYCVVSHGCILLRITWCHMIFWGLMCSLSYVSISYCRVAMTTCIVNPLHESDLRLHLSLGVQRGIQGINIIHSVSWQQFSSTPVCEPSTPNAGCEFNLKSFFFYKWFYHLLLPSLSFSPLLSSFSLPLLSSPLLLLPPSSLLSSPPSPSLFSPLFPPSPSLSSSLLPPPHLGSWAQHWPTEWWWLTKGSHWPWRPLPKVPAITAGTRDWADAEGLSIFQLSVFPLHCSISVFPLCVSLSLSPSLPSPVHSLNPSPCPLFSFSLLSHSIFSLSSCPPSLLPSHR